MTVESLNYDREANLREIVVRLRARKWWVLLSTLLVTAAFAITAFVMKPVYRSSAVLIAAGSDAAEGGVLGQRLGGLAGVAALAGINVGTAGNTDEAIAVLKSREFVEKFLTERNLLPELYEKDWDAGKHQWRNVEDIPSFARAHKDFLEDVLSVSQDTKTGLVTVSVDWHDREEAAYLANELVARLNAEMRRRALDQAEASLRYLKDELRVTSQVGIQDAINRLVESQINKRMLANVTEEYAFRVVDRAAAADENDPLRPKKALLVVVGIVLGTALGILGVIVVSALTPRR